MWIGHLDNVKFSATTSRNALIGRYWNYEVSFIDLTGLNKNRENIGILKINKEYTLVVSEGGSVVLMGFMVGHLCQKFCCSDIYYIQRYHDTMFVFCKSTSCSINITLMVITVLLTRIFSIMYYK